MKGLSDRTSVASWDRHIMESGRVASRFLASARVRKFDADAMGLVKVKV